MGRRILDLTLPPDEQGRVAAPPYECSLSDREFAIDTGRDWTQTWYTWKASGLCHKPLYFEQSHMERYGHSWGPVLDPVISGSAFLWQLAVLALQNGLGAARRMHLSAGPLSPRQLRSALYRAVPVELTRGGGPGGCYNGSNLRASVGYHIPNPMQPLVPHCGRPHPPPLGISLIGSELLLAECAAGTLSRLVIFAVPQVGHAGFSAVERMSNSKSASHLSQVYS